MIAFETSVVAAVRCGRHIDELLASWRKLYLTRKEVIHLLKTVLAMKRDVMRARVKAVMPQRRTKKKPWGENKPINTMEIYGQLIVLGHFKLKIGGLKHGLMF